VVRGAVAGRCYASYCFGLSAASCCSDGVTSSSGCCALGGRHMMKSPVRRRPWRSARTDRRAGRRRPRPSPGTPAYYASRDDDRAHVGEQGTNALFHERAEWRACHRSPAISTGFPVSAVLSITSKRTEQPTVRAAKIGVTAIRASACRHRVERLGKLRAGEAGHQVVRDVGGQVAQLRSRGSRRCARPRRLPCARRPGAGRSTAGWTRARPIPPTRRRDS